MKGLDMKRKRFVFPTVFLMLMVFSTQSFGRVEWDIQKRLKIKTAPIDVAASRDGKRIFVLSDSGSILIYSSVGRLTDKIDVGKHVDHIKIGPKDNLLLLTSRSNKTVELLTLDFIQNINIVGSPFKGAVDAPVVVAVFSDFQ